MQILHDGHGHWLTISTIGATRDAEVFVYDSLFNSVTPIVKQQIAAILFTEQNTIDLKVMDVQMQSGSANCGLFAIAFAIALVSGVQPGSVVFDQKSMRKHLHDCLQQGRLSVFTILKQRRTPVHSRLKATDSIHVLHLQNAQSQECNGERQSVWHVVPHRVRFIISFSKRAKNWCCSICKH